MNPAAKNNFRVEINGIEEIQCQKITIPTPKIIPLEFSNGSHPVKRPSSLKEVGDVTMDLLQPMDTASDFIFDIFNSMGLLQNTQRAINFLLNGLSEGRIIQYQPDNITIHRVWVFENLWAKDPGDIELDLSSAEPVIQSAVFSVDMVRQEVI